MAAGSNTLPREEILRGKTRIEQLMSAGRWAVLPHLKYCWLCTGENGVNRILVSVPKKHFKRAVKRNLLKRRIREAFRLQKDLLQDGLPSRYDILFTYVDNEVADYGTIRAAVAAILSEIRRQGTGS